MNDKLLSSYRITIETSFNDNIENLAIKMENSFNKFKRNIKNAINEADLIINEFESQKDFPNYIPHNYIKNYNYFNGVWIETEYFKLLLTKIFKNNESEHFNISILNDKIETNMVSLFYNDASLKDVTLKDGFHHIKDLLKEIEEANFLDSITYFKMDISK